MKPTSIDQLLFTRISDAGLKRAAIFRDRLARHLVQRLLIGDALTKMTDKEIYDVCNPPAPQTSTKKEESK